MSVFFEKSSSRPVSIECDDDGRPVHLETRSISPADSQNLVVHLVSFSTPIENRLFVNVSSIDTDVLRDTYLCVCFLYCRTTYGNGSTEDTQTTNEQHRYTDKRDDNKRECSLFCLNMCMSIATSVVRTMPMTVFHLRAHEKVKSFLRSIWESFYVLR